MNQNLSQIIFILDRSGSMGGLEDDTIGGFNSMIQKQKKLEGDAYISTVLFDDRIDVIHDKVDLKEIRNLTHKEYFVRGTTALLDALGKTIRKVRHDYADTLREERPSKVLFVITTDGMENASVHYTRQDIKNMIEEVQEKYKWEFIFMGANIDAIGEASKLGIRRDRSVRFHSDKVGTGKNYEAIDEVMRSYRSTGQIEKDWNKSINEDFKTRK
ncbi:vWA domain-containing protein [Candidatus Xianfuyuplasma coldseepsis]|uniref:VWFA domain-containing protein n=1 Tax=Candidatus Xianfuyuplasma coldseepsis TaxID=2782163 RepID=A0A7L7KQV9_9MOLU|nr:hypothetical protein [Xianfuyuplasma coldseepsis]QMS85113.1 hypothetical protein G4Z02_04930 [Xianfuyuplasma coldseepsis]